MFNNEILTFTLSIVDIDDVYCRITESS